MKNPFICYTAPVEDSCLVGRDKYIKRIQECLLAGASCSLSGLRRIGKTSVARQVKKNIELLNPQIKTCYIALNTITSESGFYKALADKMFHQNDFFGNKDDTDVMYAMLQNYLIKEVHENSFNGIVVVDELDSIVHQIPDANILINRIRELINRHSDYHLTFLFVSAKSLQWLQDISANVSTLSGICRSFSLGPFDKLTGLADLLKRANIESPDFLDALFNISGGHPYLASALLCAYFDNKEDGTPDSDFLYEVRLQNECAKDFLEYYINVQKFFSSWKDDKVWELLCNIVVGPCLERTTPIITNLLKTYGIITDNFLCFSEDFHDYLELQCRRTPIWPRISDFEKTMRKLVKDVLQRKLGVNWIEKLKSENPTVREMFDNMEKTMKKEQRKFNTGNADDILNYSYLGDLKTIIIKRWTWFQSYLGNSKPNFTELMDIVCSVRNPLAHNRPISDRDRVLAEDACDKIENFITTATELHN